MLCHRPALESALPSSLQRRSRVLLSTCLLLAFVASMAAAQPRQAPPPNSVESMPRKVKLGRDRGFNAWLTPVEITDKRFNPFMVQIRITGEGNLGLRRVRFVTDFGHFETEIPLQDLPKLSGAAFGNNPQPASDATLASVQRVEDRSFNIDVGQASWLTRTNSLEVTVYGRLRERSFTPTKKAIARMKAWLIPRVAKYE